MKKSQLMRTAGITLIAGIFYWSAGAVPLAASNEDDASIGTQTGEAARGLKHTAEETYQTTSQKAAETTARITPILEDALESIRAQVEVASKTINDSMHNLNLAIQKELQKFNEAYSQPKQS